MNIRDFKKVARLIRNSEVYDIHDFTMLKNLVVSLTELHPSKETKGHSHEEADEVYICLSGKGLIQIDQGFSKFAKGDLAIIPRGAFHKVFNKSPKELLFICIFEKYGDRK